MTLQIPDAKLKARSLGLAVAMTALMFMGGCTTLGPDYVPPEQTVPTSWSQASLGTTQVSESTEGVEDLSHWWTNFEDPVLTALISQALADSPTLQKAQAVLREARARHALAGAGYQPTLTASGSASRSRSSKESGSGVTRNLFSAGLDASWEADVFGGIRRNEQAAQADLEATQASLHDTQVSLAAEVALNYMNLRAYQQRLAIARASETSQAETLQLTDWRAQAGLTTTLDVDQARASLEQTRAQIPVLETGLAEAKHRLAILLGQPPGSLDERLAETGDLPVMPDRVLLGIPADTLRQRPDVQAAERSLAAETARIGVAQANRYPSFGLSGSLGLEALTLNGLTGNALAGSLVANVVGTLFDGGRLAQQVEIQNAVQAQALANYRATVLTALEDVENALVSLTRGRQRQASLVKAEAAAASAADLARQQYQAGLVDFQSVLASQRTLLDTRDSLKSSEADTANALIQLYKALGGGWSNTPESPGSLQGNNHE